MKRTFVLIVLLLACSCVHAQKFVQSVGTVAELVRLNPYSIQTNNVMVLGYTNANDGYGGVFYPTNTALGTNRYYLISSANYTGWSWKRVDTLIPNLIVQTDEKIGRNLSVSNNLYVTNTANLGETYINPSYSDPFDSYLHFNSAYWPTPLYTIRSHGLFKGFEITDSNNVPFFKRWGTNIWMSGGNFYATNTLSTKVYRFDAYVPSQEIVRYGDLSPVPVTAFGAKGDGMTDDTIAVRTGIAAVSAGGTNATNTLYFPPGIYIVGPITISNITIDFGTATILPNTTTNWLTVDHAYEAYRPASIKGGQFSNYGVIVPSSLIVLSNGANNTLIEGITCSSNNFGFSVIWNQAAYGTTVRNCRFGWNNSPNIIYLSAQASLATYSIRFSMYNVDITGATIGVYIQGGQDITIRENVIEKCTTGSIYYDNNFKMGSLAIIGNHFENAGSLYDIYLECTNQFDYCTATISQNISWSDTTNFFKFGGGNNQIYR